MAGFLKKAPEENGFAAAAARAAALLLNELQSRFDKKLKKSPGFITGGTKCDAVKFTDLLIIWQIKNYQKSANIRARTGDLCVISTTRYQLRHIRIDRHSRRSFFNTLTSVLVLSLFTT